MLLIHSNGLFDSPMHVQLDGRVYVAFIDGSKYFYHLSQH